MTQSALLSPEALGLFFGDFTGRGDKNCQSFGSGAGGSSALFSLDSGELRKHGGMAMFSFSGELRTFDSGELRKHRGMPLRSFAGDSSAPTSWERGWLVFLYRLSACLSLGRGWLEFLHGFSTWLSHLLFWPRCLLRRGLIKRCASSDGLNHCNVLHKLQQICQRAGLDMACTCMHACMHAGHRCDYTALHRPQALYGHRGPQCMVTCLWHVPGLLIAQVPHAVNNPRGILPAEDQPSVHDLELRSKPRHVPRIISNYRCLAESLKSIGGCKHLLQ